MRPVSSLALASFILVLGCADNISKLRATGSGDLSNPRAPRQQADAELVSACGDGALTSLGHTRLVREPYLQQVGADSARVLFSLSEDTPVTVNVSRPDGSPVAELTADASECSENGVVLSELEPRTIYCYELRGLTSRAGFRTAPAKDSGKPIRFAVLGDSGVGDQFQRAVYRQLMTVPLDFVLHAGDIAYDSGRESELNASFFRVYYRMLRKFPVFPVIGNHDDATDQAAAYLRAFALPENGSDLAPERYYSLDWGDVHFVALDTENIDVEQADWLDADLTNNRRRWTVVMGHRPPYSSGAHGPYRPFQQRFVPIIERHRVPLVFSGHEHNYERIKQRNGVTYVVTGGGGRETRPVHPTLQTAYAEDVLHFVFVEIEGDTLLLHAIDGTGREFDSARIERPKG